MKIRTKSSVKFLGVIIDENLTWKNHIEVIENQISKNIEFLYRTSRLLDFKYLLKIYFSFIHIYINYANLAWTSTFKTKLQGILKKQKYAARIIFHAKRFDHLKPLLKEMKALNVCQINIIHTVKLMYKTKCGINPQIFLPKFRVVDHQNPTRFFQNSLYYKKSACKTTRFAITLLVPTIWNSFLRQQEKSPVFIFKIIKFKLINSNKEA